MSGKRQATTDLNHDNWDREEEPEDRGTFRTATEEELKNRVIKKAKRKIVQDTGSDTADGSSKSVFSNFSGFGKPAASVGASTAASPFSFLSKIPAVAAATSGVVSSSTTTAASTPAFSFGSVSTTATCTNSTKSSKTLTFTSSGDKAVHPAVNAATVKTAKNSALSDYHQKLSSLNQAVSEWIKTHVNKNPVCILSPIFKDYEKYLEEIESAKRNAESETTVPNVETIKSSSTSSATGNFKFSTNSGNSNDSIKYTGPSSTTSEIGTKSNGFSFAPVKSTDVSQAQPITSKSFSFGLNTSTTPATATSSTTMFSFGNAANKNDQPPSHQKPFSFNPGSTPFSFGNIKPPEISATTTSTDDTNEDECDEPPKNDFKQVVEDDAVYSKKCKVFVKKDGNFVDKGVGTLYLKPVASSVKTQLLVRADTNLGKILVNLILNSAIPTQRMGKNNVMMVCVPTPDVEKPTSMLLRVKTGEEADDLLENINKHKK